MGKLVPFDELKKLVDKARTEGRTIGFTSGAFDALHSGHLKHLEVCRQLVGKTGTLFVAICNDKLLKQVKGTDRPLDKELVRAEAVAAQPEVDYVVIDSAQGFVGMVHLSIIDELCPDIWVGPDEGLISLALRRIVAERRNIMLFVHKRIPPEFLPEGISTTQIIAPYRRLRRSLRRIISSRR